MIGGALSDPSYDMNRTDHVEDLANMYEFIIDYKNNPDKHKRSAKDYLKKIYGKYIEENKKKNSTK